MNDVFVVPLKDFDVAKERLRAGGATDVTHLARSLAANVLANCAPRQIIVLSESLEITRFAHECGVEVRESRATSLNEAVQLAYAALEVRYERLLIVHGDLRSPEGLGQYSPDPGVTIVTDHHGRGTNLLVVPTGLEFHFAYGPDSAERHRREAERLGVITSVITDSPWGFDVDEPEDLV